jgi:hypothetical protein
VFFPTFLKMGMFQCSKNDCTNWSNKTLLLKTTFQILNLRNYYKALQIVIDILTCIQCYLKKLCQSETAKST